MTTVMRCVEAVARAFGVPVADIRFGGREFEYSHPRQAVMLLARWEGYSYPRISRELKLDYTTVQHGCHAAALRADADEEYGDKLQQAWIGMRASTG